MELKNKIWMTGDLEWVAYIGDEAVFLGRREVPIPLEEGDTWVNHLGDRFVVEDATIRLMQREEPPKRYW